MLRKTLPIGAALAIAMALFVPSLGGRSAPAYAAPPGSACSVNGTWNGFDIGAPPGSVTLVITEQPGHQNFTWIAYAGGPPPPIGVGVPIADGNGVVLPDFSFHIEGHGVPNALVHLKNVKAQGTLMGCPGPQITATYTYQADYTDGTPPSSGIGVLMNFINTG